MPANDPVVIHDATGQTVDVKFYAAGTLSHTESSVSESPASSGRYAITDADLSALAAGDYDLRIEIGGGYAASGSLSWDGSGETISTQLDATFAALNDISAADVNAQCDAALADYDAPTKAEMDAGFAALNDLSAAEVNAEVDTALSDYDAPTKAEMDAAFAGLNDIDAATVNAQVDTALADIHLDHLLAADYDPAAKPGVATALLNELIEDDSGVSRFTANALEQGPSPVVTATAVADAVWDEAYADHSSGTAFGGLVAAINTAVGALNDIDSTAAQAACAAALAAYNTVATTDLPANFSTQVIDANGRVDVSLIEGSDATASVQSSCDAAITAYNVVATTDLPTNFASQVIDASGRVDVSLIEGSDASDVINTQVDTALTDIHLDHLLAADYNPASKPGASTALLNELVENDGGVSRLTANALENAPTDGLDASGVRAAIGMAAADLDTQLDAIAVTNTETRDLEPPQHVWRVPSRAGGVLESPDVLRIAPGETIVAGFDLLSSLVLPTGSVVGTFTDPTGISGEISATKKGTNGRFCNVTIVATSSAVAGTEQLLTVDVTNSFGDGPHKVTGRILVAEATV